jgi:glycosyltransferase involved in cell wall biosynthesis
MKVVFATGIFPPDIGGPATYVDGLARELVRGGTEVEVVTYGEGEESETPPFPVARIDRSRSLPIRYASFFRAVRRSLRSEALAYLQDPVSAGLPAACAALSKRAPMVVKIVGDLAWEIGRENGLVAEEIEEFQSRPHRGIVKRLQAAQRFVARSANRVVTPSAFLKKIVTGWGVDPGRIEVIFNAVRPPESPLASREQARRRLGLEPGPIVITAGRMVPWKGFETVVEAMPGVLLREPEARLLVAGSGPGEKALRRQIESAGLGRSILLLGPLGRESLALHLRASDVFVLGSTYEGFSHVLLEAMLAELPVVASRVGGNPEVIEDGEHGLLVDPEPPSIVSALVRLLQDQNLREALGRRGRERAEMFRWQDMVGRTTALLQDAAETSSKRRR